MSSTDPNAPFRRLQRRFELRLLTIALATVALIFAMPSTVLAGTPAAKLDRQSRAEIAVAQRLLAKRGITGCERVTVTVIPMARHFGGLTEMGSCTVRLNRRLFKAARRAGSDHQFAIETECAVIYHEMHHAYGWKPSPSKAVGDPYHSTGVMLAHGGELYPPRACRRLAAKLAKR